MQCQQHCCGYALCNESALTMIIKTKSIKALHTKRSSFKVTIMASRFNLPQSSSSSHDNEADIYAAQRQARLQQWRDRRDRADQSPGWSDEREALPEEIAAPQARAEEREQIFRDRTSSGHWCSCISREGNPGCVPIDFAKTI